jgi:hypothetical protein
MIPALGRGSYRYSIEFGRRSRRDFLQNVDTVMTKQ